MRRALLVAALLLVGALVGVLVQRSLADPAEDERAPEEISTEVAQVVRTDLIQTETLEGRLRHAGEGTVISQRAGTVTSLPEEAEVLGAGDIAFEIDGRGVEIFQGSRPMWRTLGDGVADGADIEQLEENLVRLGFAEFEPDREFDDDTADAIERWQEDRGLEATSTVVLGDVLFAEQVFRVGEMLVSVGSTIGPGTPVYATTSTEREVVIEFDPADLDLVAVGDPVTVVLPDDAEVQGEIVEIASIVRRLGPDPDAPEVVDVIIDLDVSGIALTSAPVDVEIERDRAAGVLAVPVRALVSLSDGGYAVEVAEGDRRSLVGVAIGDFAGGLVEVEGALTEGDLVVVPVD